MFNIDRRSLLKSLGIASAIVPSGTYGEHDKPEAEHVKVDPPPMKDYKTQDLDRFRAGQESIHYYDVVTEYLYDSIEVGRKFEPGMSMLLDHRGDRLPRRINDARDKYELFTDVEYNSGKTMIDTNLWQNGKLDAPETYAVGSVSVLFSPTVRPEVRASFAERYYIELWVGKKEYFRAPVASLFSVGQPDALPEQPVIGTGKLEIPVIIGCQMRFFVNLNGKASANDDLKLWVLLGNMHARGVQ